MISRHTDFVISKVKSATFWAHSNYQGVYNINGEMVREAALRKAKNPVCKSFN